MAVGVIVAPGVVVRVGRGGRVGVMVGMDAMNVAFADSAAACEVNAMTVGRYSGG
jgi:hypothetical protein